MEIIENQDQSGGNKILSQYQNNEKCVLKQNLS